MTDWIDLALIYDGDRRSADLALGPDGDLLLDETPATAMLVSIGSDRRARPDDELPAGIGDLNAPVSFVERRGWCGDAVDAEGRLIGSRLWLADRNKETELTRRLYEEWAREALAWVQAETGRAAEIAAEWVRPHVLALRAVVDGRSVTINRRLG